MCTQCQLTKMTKSSFNKRSYSSTEVLELVHTNLCEPIAPRIYCGAMYFILFVDYYSRMMTIMFLKEK